MASSPTAKTRQQHGTNVTPFAKDPSIPVFHPSTQEFKDPVAYLSSIRQQAEPFGMCKIVPPSGWRPSFAINKEQCTLPTRIQALHMLQHISEHDAEVQQGNTGGKRFLIDYKAWLTRQGKTFRKPPQLYGQDVDLAALYSAVTRRGGFQACCDAGAWRTVAKALQIKDRRGDAANQLRTMYSKTLLDYEQEQCTTKTHAGGAPSTQPSTSGAAGAVGTVVVQDEDEKSAQTTTGGFDGGVGEGGQTSPAAGGGGYGKTRSKVSKDALASLKDRSRRCSSRQQEADGERIPANLDVLMCDVCTGGHREDMIVLCDGCDKGCHSFCMNPPVPSPPEGDWYCSACLTGNPQVFASREGPQMSMSAFSKAADEFYTRYTTEEGNAEATLPDLEHEFWQLVTAGDVPVEVHSAFDLDTRTVGSGFTLPTARAGDTKTHPWNLNNLPRVKGSLLRWVDKQVAGVTVPNLHVGMLFSSFCWRLQEQLLYNANYRHWGKPVQWYVVPAAATESMTEAFAKALATEAASQPGVLWSPATLLDPEGLRAQGLPVHSVVQHEGEIIITFPGAHHAGFYYGLGCSESVCIAPPDWLRVAGSAAQRCRTFCKAMSVAQEELLVRVAEACKEDAAAASQLLPWIIPELQRVYTSEHALRLAVWASGVLSSRRMTEEDPLLVDEEAPECRTCRAPLYLSAVQCDCSDEVAVCLNCAESLCNCDKRKHTLVYRHTLPELDDILQSTKALLDPKTPSPTNTDNPLANAPLYTSDLPDASQVGAWRALMTSRALDWQAQAKEVFSIGGVRATDVDHMLTEAQGFMWTWLAGDVQGLEARLKDARAWCTKVNGFAKGRPHLNELASIVDWDPMPIAISSFNRLKESYYQGLAWQKRAADILGDNGGLPVPFSVLEKLSNESTRLGCLLPRAKEVRVRLAAVRALLAEVDAALPPPPAGSSDDEDEEGEDKQNNTPTGATASRKRARDTKPSPLSAEQAPPSQRPRTREQRTRDASIVNHSSTSSMVGQQHDDGGQPTGEPSPAEALPPEGMDVDHAEKGQDTHGQQTMETQQQDTSSTPPTARDVSTTPDNTTPTADPCRSYGAHLWGPDATPKGPTLEQLQSFAQRAADMHVTCSAIERLQGVVARVGAWQAAVRDAWQSSGGTQRGGGQGGAHKGSGQQGVGQQGSGGQQYVMQQQVAAELLKQAAELPVYLEAAEGLAVAMEQADTWQHLATQVLSSENPPLARYKELLHAASKLPIHVDTTAITTALHARQWVEGAGKLCHGAASCAQIEGVLKEAKEVGLGDSELVVDLSTRLSSMQNLLQRITTASDQLDPTKGPPPTPTPPPTLDTLRTLTTEATQLNMTGEPALDTLRTRMLATAGAVRWLTSTAHMLTSARGKGGGTLGGGAGGSAQEGYVQTTNTTSSLLERVEQAVGQVELVPLALEGGDALQARVNAAQEWIGRAEAACGVEEGFIDFDTLTALLGEGHAVRAVPPTLLTQLDTQRNALLWCLTVKSTFAAAHGGVEGLPALPQAPPTQCQKAQQEQQEQEQQQHKVKPIPAVEGVMGDAGNNHPIPDTTQSHAGEGIPVGENQGEEKQGQDGSGEKQGEDASAHGERGVETPTPTTTAAAAVAASPHTGAGRVGGRAHASSSVVLVNGQPLPDTIETARLLLQHAPTYPGAIPYVTWLRDTVLPPLEATAAGGAGGGDDGGDAGAGGASQPTRADDTAGAVHDGAVHETTTTAVRVEGEQAGPCAKRARTDAGPAGGPSMVGMQSGEEVEGAAANTSGPALPVNEEGADGQTAQEQHDGDDAMQVDG